MGIAASSQAPPRDDSFSFICPSLQNSYRIIFSPMTRRPFFLYLPSVVNIWYLMNINSNLDYMSRKKGSEVLFEDYCDKHSIQWRRIPEGTEKRPDYYVYMNGQLVVIEVKQFDLNEEEKNVWERVNDGEAFGYAVKTKYRIRRKIKEGKEQLKPYSKRPTLLVLFDNTGGLLSLDSDDILQAMHGNSVFKYLIPDSPEIEPILTDHFFGGGQKLTSSRTTYISGVVRLFKPPFKSEFEIHIFHNRYSTNPLETLIASKLASKQFKLVDNKHGNYAHWEEVS